MSPSDRRVPAARAATGVQVGQVVTYGTVFYEAGDDLDKKGAYPGDGAAEWYCLESLKRDLFGRGPGELAVLGFSRADQSGPRGPRTYCSIRARRIS